jgi:hypothetical protein
MRLDGCQGLTGYPDIPQNTVLGMLSVYILYIIKISLCNLARNQRVEICQP